MMNKLPEGWAWVCRNGMYALDKEHFLQDPHKRNRGIVWEKHRGGDARCTWHTFDEMGSGGENDAEELLEEAKRQVEYALARAGWTNEDPPAGPPAPLADWELLQVEDALADADWTVAARTMEILRAYEKVLNGEI